MDTHMLCSPVFVESDSRLPASSPHAALLHPFSSSTVLVNHTGPLPSFHEVLKVDGTNNLSPLESALTKTRGLKSFRIRTYEKGAGEGGIVLTRDSANASDSANGSSAIPQPSQPENRTEYLQAANSLPEILPFNARAYLDALFAAHGPQHWWPGRTPFEIIVGAILVQNTSWTNVATAIEHLRRAKLLTPRAIETVSAYRLGRLIRSSGYFRQKTKKLKNFTIFLRR